MFKHFNTEQSANLFGRIIASVKDFAYLRVKVEANSAFFGGDNAPKYYKAGDTIEDANGAYIMADSDTTFTELTDSENKNMLANSYLGNFISTTTLKEGRIIKANIDKKIKKIVINTGAIWVIN